MEFISGWFTGHPGTHFITLAGKGKNPYTKQSKAKLRIISIQKEKEFKKRLSLNSIRHADWERD